MCEKNKPLSVNSLGDKLVEKITEDCTVLGAFADMDNRPYKTSVKIPTSIMEVKRNQFNDLHCHEKALRMMLGSGGASFFKGFTDVMKVRRILRGLTDEIRLDIFGEYCRHCGTIDPESKCNCWNDY